MTAHDAIPGPSEAQRSPMTVACDRCGTSLRRFYDSAGREPIAVWRWGYPYCEDRRDCAMTAIRSHR